MRTLAVFLVLGLAACGAGAANSEAAQQKAALQAYFDAHPQEARIVRLNDKICTYSYAIDEWERTYRGVPGFHVATSRSDRMCLTLTVDPDVGAKSYAVDANHAREGTYVPLGHYVVDKAGEAVKNADGQSMVPVAIHLDATPTGKALIANGAAPETKLTIDRSVPMVKDASGNWVIAP